MTASLKLGISNVEYVVYIAKDGDQWCAMMGPNLQEGIAGFGEDIAHALIDLSLSLIRGNYNE